jgi:putative hydrolase of the HAD superfamily
VVFDIGGVLARPGSHFAELAAVVGADPAVLEKAYWRHRDAYDLGASPRAYWSQVALDAGSEPSRYQFEELDDLDAARWSTLVPGRADLLKSISDAGVRVCLLSNAPHSLAERVRRSAWADLAPVKVFSCEIGVAKPSTGAYLAVEARLGLSGDQLAFFDDRAANVVGARSRGWRAFVWESQQLCRDTLRDLGVLDG